MNLTVYHHRADRYAAAVVTAALRRSFTQAQVAAATYGASGNASGAGVFIRPGAAARDLLQHFCQRRRKALVLGRLAAAVARDLGLRPLSVERPPTPASDPCPLSVRYSTDHALGQAAPISQRPLWRFDFADEWNNLGFGRIGLGRDDWSLDGAYEADGATVVAHLVEPSGRQKGVYTALREDAESAILWYNRAVGPVDSLEWQVVEAFLGDYRADDLLCFPYLSEIPADYRGAVCARLDCDEAVASARSLCEAYAATQVPLSLAVVTGMGLAADDLKLLRDVQANGGAIVSHSVRHLPDWGGNYDTALAEGQASKAWLEKHVPTAAPMQFVVSPFHQNSIPAVRALAAAGYTGFVGGIIRNDPEFILGRAGAVPFVPGIVSHSQQCMLHGDCYRQENGPAIYLRSFEQHLRGHAIFGYLDHPFSARYQYGWASEQERRQAHEGLLRHMAATPDLWRPNLQDCLAFLRKRDATTAILDDQGALQVHGPGGDGLPTVAVRWQGRTRAA